MKDLEKAFSEKDKKKRSDLVNLAKEKCKSELKKLKSMSPMSAEATVIRNYLDWLLSIPWNNPKPISKNIKVSSKCLIKITSSKNSRYTDTSNSVFRMK